MLSSIDPGSEGTELMRFSECLFVTVPAEGKTRTRNLSDRILEEQYPRKSRYSLCQTAYGKRNHFVNKNCQHSRLLMRFCGFVGALSSNEVRLLIL